MISNNRAAVICIGGAGKAVAGMLRERRCKADVITADMADADIIIAEDTTSVAGILGKYRFIYIVAGMGGRTGTAVAPEIARICVSESIDFSVGLIMPFSFETRTEAAKEGLGTIRMTCEPTVFSNDATLANKDMTLKDALRAVDSDVCNDIISKISLRKAAMRGNRITAPLPACN